MSVKNQITTPYGIDVAIKKLQQRFSDDLFSGYTYYSYPRTYEIDGKQCAFEAGIDYKQLFTNDRIDALSYFVCNKEESVDIGMFKCTVDIYFFVNTKAIYSSVTNRADANARKEVTDLMDMMPYGFELESIEWDIDEGVNLEPYHSFKLSTTLYYDNIKC